MTMSDTVATRRERRQKYVSVNIAVIVEAAVPVEYC
jgi:hypothetical protein